MAIVNKSKSDRIDIPHEPGEWVELAALSHGDLKRAAAAKDREALVTYQELAAAQDAKTAIKARSFVAEIRAELGEDGIRKVQESGGFWDTYSERSIMSAAVVAWSYAEPVTPENLDALDEVTSQWLRNQIEARNTLGEEQAVNLESASSASMKAGADGLEN